MIQPTYEKRCPATIAESERTKRSRRYASTEPREPNEWDKKYFEERLGVDWKSAMGEQLLRFTAMYSFLDLEGRSKVEASTADVECIIEALGGIRASVIGMDGDTGHENGDIVANAMKCMQAMCALWLSGTLDRLWFELAEYEREHPEGSE